MRNFGQAQVVIRFLGDFSIEINGRPVRHWRAGRARSLFQYLLVNRNKIVLKERLYEVLWPGIDWSPQSSSLKVAVHAVRRTLESYATDGGWFEVAYQDYGYVLRVRDGVWVDFEQFQVLIQQARIDESRGNVDAAVRYYTRAAELYRGDFLPGEAADWASEQREWLRGGVLHALRFLSSYWMQRGDLGAAIAYCQSTLGIEPFLEDAYRTLIEAHAQRGEFEQAKRWYDLCRQRLCDHLGVSPAEATDRLLARMVPDRRVHREAVEGRLAG